MRSIFSFVLLFFSINLFCQNTPCSNFKNGQFKYSNSDYAEWTITRNDSVQIEINIKKGIEIHSKVEWKSDCKYILTCKTVSKDDLKNAIGVVFEVFIYETFNDSYKCISKSNDLQSEDIKLEMIKIK